ncbi:MAG: glycosyltransferase [Erysipelotrichaceae bacterium]
MKKCDIIIPIYNAFDYLQKCLKSIINSTDLHHHGLILIDDKSTDERMKPYLQSFLKEYSNFNITLLINEQNSGFVRTVNKGMKYSKNDILLLNSDTEVCEGWLDRIVKCAYSELNVATVTPLSNNATLVSVPTPLHPNDLPVNFDFKTYSNIINKCSYHDYPMIPTSHGFCMYIRREAIDLVGYFDDETFGIGYGEENEFSFRCLDFGLKHLLCDDVLIYHKESQSFNEKKDQLIKNNMKLLSKKHPVYSRKIETWCEDYPISYINKNIIYNINMYNRKNILFVIHDWSEVKENLGGTTIHCVDLIRNLRKNYNFHVLAPEHGIFKVYSYFENEESLLEFDGISTIGNINFTNKKYKEMVRKLMKGLNISILHVHHMIGHYFDIVDVANELQIPSYITLHDFYCLCPTINMLFNMEKYCLNIKNRDCKTCLKNKLNIPNDLIPVWENEWTNFLKKFKLVITPSFSTKQIIESQLIDVNCIAMEHGINIKKETSLLNIRQNNEFNVAFVGVMAIHKGGKVVEYLIKNTKDKRIKYHLFGTSEINFLKKNRSNFVNHGKYKREELSILLKKNNINMVANLSIWPETYSYTLTETIASGVPVLGYSLGAVGERIEKNKFGWLMSENSTGNEILSKIIEISTDVDKYDEVIKNLNDYKIKSTMQMAEEYSLLYNNPISKNDVNVDDLKLLVKLDYEINVASATELDRILNSRKWKVVEKIKVPTLIKEIGKKIIR